MIIVTLGTEIDRDLEVEVESFFEKSLTNPRSNVV